jgi:hypothetical protein
MFFIPKRGPAKKHLAQHPAKIVDFQKRRQKNHTDESKKGAKPRFGVFAKSSRLINLLAER